MFVLLGVLTHNESMKIVSRHFVRSRKAAGVLASLRVEDLSPSVEVATGLNAVVQGRLTTADLMKQVRLKYVTVRRV